MPRLLSLGQVPHLVYAVGDVHGCFDLYRALEAQIARAVLQHSDGANRAGSESAGSKLAGSASAGSESAGSESAPALLLVLGDMIDRGPASAQMLDHLLAPPPRGITRQALMGNHEAMFLRFMAAPRLDHPWLGHGGAQMLASYGIDVQDPGLAKRGRLAQALAASLPVEHVDYIAGLPHGVAMGGRMAGGTVGGGRMAGGTVGGGRMAGGRMGGGTIFAHAGVNPARFVDLGVNPARFMELGVNPARFEQTGVNPAGFEQTGINPAGVLETQTVDDLLWGDPALLDAVPDFGAGDFGLRVVHGHRPELGGPELGGPEFNAPALPDLASLRRINLDTGAYGTGRLTGLEIVDGVPARFMVAKNGDIS